ncbi:MAG: hypothetical protein ACK56I_03800, partial [bacterium]
MPQREPVRPHAILPLAVPEVHVAPRRVPAPDESHLGSHAHRQPHDVALVGEQRHADAAHQRAAVGDEPVDRTARGVEIVDAEARLAGREAQRVAQAEHAHRGWQFAAGLRIDPARALVGKRVQQRDRQPARFRRQRGQIEL